jgi:hypothetical protein
MPIGHHTDNSDQLLYEGIWPLLLFLWPAWLVIMPVVVYSSDRNWRKLFVPLVLGSMILVPAVFYLLMVMKLLYLLQIH